MGEVTGLPLGQGQPFTGHGTREVSRNVGLFDPCPKGALVERHRSFHPPHPVSFIWSLNIDGYLPRTGHPRGGRQRPLNLMELSVYRRSQAMHKMVSGWTGARKNIKLGNEQESNGEGEALLEEVILN